MTESQNTLLDDVTLRGFRLMYFEFIWPAFRWIESIWIREKNGQLQLFVQTSDSQNETEWDDLDYLVREIFEHEEQALDREEPGSKHKIEYIIQHGPSIPKDCGYRELMSDRLFKKLAKRLAPSRLEIGR